MSAEQAQLTVLNFPKDAYITIEEVDDANRFFIISSGHVQISRKVKDVPGEGDKVIGPGDFFGVSSTMAFQPRIETSRALTDVAVIAVKQEQYPMLIQRNQALAIKIVVYISQRVRKYNETFTKISLKKTQVQDPDQLFKIAEYYSKQGIYEYAHYAYSQYVKHNENGVFIKEAGDAMAKIASYTKTAKKHEAKHKPNDTKRVYPKGSLIFCESEPGNELFVIQSGSVKITKIIEDKEALLAVLAVGDMFGEMSLLESMPRAATAIANEDCSVMVVSRENFKKMIETQPQMISKLTTLLSERLWLLYNQIKNLKIQDHQRRIYDMLGIHIRRKRVDVKKTHSFTFDFGPNELVEMIGLPNVDGKAVVKKFLENRNVKVVDNKIHVADINEILKKS